MLLILTPLEHKIINDVCERRCKITRIDRDGEENTIDLWFKFSKSISLPKDDDCDSYTLAVIMDAMKENRNIEIKGSVSEELLSNLVEYQAAWNKWLPNTYSKIDIFCNNIRKTSERSPGAICAFSGGVDATFSVLRHSKSKLSYRSKKINLCAIVHGFDIPTEDENAFKKAKDNAGNTLADIDIDLYSIKTNYREISKVNWEHSFSCALVAALSNFKKSAGTCLVGSSEPYDSLVIPWGSSPITDHLLSSDEFFVIHDGASHSRTEKVEEIAIWKTGIDNLRVCWQGDLKDRNCGVCEKCVRTKLNFLATGNYIPKCFPDSDIIDDLKKIKLGNNAVRAEWRQIYQYATKNKVNSSWVHQLPRIINKKSLVEKMLPKGSTRRELVKNLTKKFTQAN